MAAPEIIQRFLGPTFFATSFRLLQYSLTVASSYLVIEEGSGLSSAVYHWSLFTGFDTDNYSTAGSDKCLLNVWTPIGSDRS